MASMKLRLYFNYRWHSYYARPSVAEHHVPTAETKTAYIRTNGINITSKVQLQINRTIVVFPHRLQRCAGLYIYINLINTQNNIKLTVSKLQRVVYDARVLSHYSYAMSGKERKEHNIEQEPSACTYLLWKSRGPPQSSAAQLSCLGIEIRWHKCRREKNQEANTTFIRSLFRGLRRPDSNRNEGMSDQIRLKLHPSQKANEAAISLHTS